MPNSNIVITADSTCDLSPATMQEKNIKIQPLYIIKEGTSYRDQVDIQPSEIFSYVEQTGNVSSTSAATVQDYLDLFSPLVEAGNQVIHINISSHFSSCHQNACIAAKELEEGKIFVVDSLNLSTGSGLSVIEACEMAEKGLPAEEIVTALNNKVVPSARASFVLDKLTYLHKGGRCSSVAQLGANLLKLKPCIEVKEGKMDVGKKYRGSYEKSVLQYVEDRLKDRTDLDLKRIFITHTPCSDHLIKEVHKKILELQPFQEVLITQAGCTISNHCGPNTLGILFCTK